MNFHYSKSVGKRLTGLFIAPAIAFGSASILDDSPFLPPGFNAPSTVAPQRNAAPSADERYLEFRGVYQLANKLFFNIYDKRSKRGAWVNLNQADAEYKVVRFDDGENSVTLDIDGRETTLSLVETSNRSLPVATAPSIPNRPQPPTVRPPTPSPSTSPVRRRVIRPSNTPSNRSTTGRRSVVNGNP